MRSSAAAVSARAPPLSLLSINDILATFGAFLAVLIAIEIFSSLTLCLSKNVIHVKIVMATALMAVARKVIVFGYDDRGWEYILATGVVVLALGVAYWMISRVDPHKITGQSPPAEPSGWAFASLNQSRQHNPRSPLESAVAETWRRMANAVCGSSQGRETHPDRLRAHPG